MTYIEVAPLATIPAGEGIRLVPEGEVPIAVFHTEDGEVLAIDDTCTHQEAPLSQGWLEGCLVECPIHSATFDLRTGEATLPATKPVRTHAVEIRDGVIFVELSTAAPNLPA
ncbi:bifunctional 3-phenylpropionate/cinnamic acid dioxygenase ferredoxin subunit [Nocardioides sp.]|uniref:bifunctional 3-phenylpropionate/cinnamic acid dioxygenase ferredoxin subunit n=1 Tax=Nocardioides sp. TaxID=35761 RepID=UPI00261484A4|nr:bifunctional 3-phenylpropionate/cinnamic acid dioxygenase ferredoxin subunit [Nocardioides sp.]